MSASTLDQRLIGEPMPSESPENPASDEQPAAAGGVQPVVSQTPAELTDENGDPIRDPVGYAKAQRAKLARVSAREKELAERVALYEAAEAEKAEEAARAAGDFESLEASLKADLQKRDKALIDARLDAEFARLGVTDPEVAALMRTHLATHAQVDPKSLAVTGDYAAKAKALAEKLSPKKEEPAQPPRKSTVMLPSPDPNASSTKATPQAPWSERMAARARKRARER